MKWIKAIYLNLYIIIFALYVYLGKGIAYSYAAEILLLIGIIVIVFDYKSFELFKDKRAIIILFLLFINIIFIINGVKHYKALEVLRDSFMFNYAFFIFIIFLFKDDLIYFASRIFLIYKWYPFVQCGLLLLSYSSRLEDYSLFGDTPILYFKFGDIAVHLLIATILFLNNYIKFKSKAFSIVFIVLIVYLYMVASSYSRAAMVGFMLSFILFFSISLNGKIKKLIFRYLKWLPLAVVIALPFYLQTKVDEDFQGRKPGIEQLRDNVASVFTSDGDGSLNDNKVWRLLWWGKIIGYTFGGEHFLNGKGLGVNLKEDDEIESDIFPDLRSPHSFHLNVLARFGVPIFFIWMYWIYISFNRTRRFRADPFEVMMGIIFFMFIFNASFDVYLEGPMGGLPFWTFVGLHFAFNAYNLKPVTVPSVSLNL